MTKKGKEALINVSAPKDFAREARHTSSNFHYTCRRLNTLQTLKEQDLLRRIVALDLYDVSLAGDRVDALVDEPGLENVHTLVFQKNKLKDGLTKLTDAACLANLRDLTIKRNQLTAESLGALGRSPCGERLESLVLYFEKLTADKVQELMAHASWGAVQYLELNYCQLKSDALAELFEPGAWGSLTSLNLTTNKIDAAGLEALIAAPFASQLTRLNLHYNKIGDAEAEVLANAPSLSNLEVLVLTENQKISAEGRRMLAESEHLSEKVRKKYAPRAKN